MSSQNLLFLGTQQDKPFLPRLKPVMKGITTFVKLDAVSTITEVELYCRAKSVSGVLTTSIPLLSRLTDKPNPSLDAYSGSYFQRNGIEYVFVNPLDHTVSVPYGTFLLERYASKLVSPKSWRTPSKFNWSVISPRTADSIYAAFASPNCIAIAIDIETYRENLAIRCVGYTAIFDTGSDFETTSVVIPMDSDWTLHQVRKFNALPAAKIFQNGKYDCAYLSRYNAAPFNYLWDTANLFHSYYSELPKDLAFLQSFFVRNAAYWKDLAESSDLETYYLYNAKDTWATAEVFLAWMHEAPAWAKKNYTLEFPLTFPAHLSEMTGVKRDLQALKAAKLSYETEVDTKSASLDRMLGVKGFNTNSYKQKQVLLRLLGCGDIEGTDEKSLSKAAFRHPLNARILELVTEIQKDRKLLSTYLVEGKELNERILYALNPHGTDTGRLASKEHHFWCGLQIQNIPRGDAVKSTIVADEGFFFGECDLEQAEARDTAFAAGDESLITAVTGTRDFHSVNASAFFGRAYDAIYDDGKKKTKDKPLRDLAKRVNHGANYNMGAGVLVETMGLKNIYAAAKFLSLPKSWTPKEIAQYLLDQFDKTYPRIRGEYQTWIISQVLTHKRLTGATGWTRYCFDNPKTNKRALNAYVAHVAQSLNAMVLNQAYLKVFYDIALHPDHRNNFKLCAQIHDSILFQYRIGHEYLAEMVKDRMEIPVTILGADGKIRTFTVPAAIKIGNAKYWSQTE